MRIAIASDHGGFHLKRELAEKLRAAGHVVEDLGPHSDASCDYPDFAHAMAKTIVAASWELGVLVCGTGVGMAMSANRHEGVFAVNCSDVYTARLSRSHNGSNVLCLGERVVGPGLAWEIVTAWLAEPVSNDARHERRRRKIEPASS